MNVIKVTYDNDTKKYIICTYDNEDSLDYTK